jgi:hypothetical protein
VRDTRKLDWERIRLEVLGGETIANVAARHGTKEGRVAMRASREGWDVNGSRRKILEVANEGKVSEIEVEIQSFWRRLRGSSMRCRAELSEQVEETLRELRNVPAVVRSRCLTSLASVCEKLYRWGEEPTPEELGRMKNAAVNIRLIRTSPEQLRLMAKTKRGVEEPGGGGVGRQSQGASG